jgi:hypothetical protein
MLAADHDLNRFAQWLERIEHAETRDAFRFLVGAAACVRGLKCHAQLKGPNGPLHDFRLFDSNGEQPFSFTTNQSKGLLFYFRAPAIRSRRYIFVRLKAVLDSASENFRADWTVRINNIEEARRLWAHLDIA